VLEKSEGMRMGKKAIAVITTILLLTVLPGCASVSRKQVEQTVAETVAETGTEGEPSTETVSEIVSDAEGKVTVSFDYEKQSGYASNQFAVWIEDVDGVLVKTLYATQFTATGGFSLRPDSIALWVKKSEVASLPSESVDAITGATPKSGHLEYVWDISDGEAVPAGDYRFVVEGSLRWQNSVLCSGMIAVGNTADVAKTDPKYTFSTTETQPALSEASPEANMIRNVAAAFVPSP
jgi:hypothetical protein